MAEQQTSFSFAVELLNNPVLKQPLSVYEVGTLMLTSDSDGTCSGTITIPEFTNPINFVGSFIAGPNGFNIVSAEGSSQATIWGQISIMNGDQIFSGSYLGGTITINDIGKNTSIAYVLAGYTT